MKSTQSHMATSMPSETCSVDVKREEGNTTVLAAVTSSGDSTIKIVNAIDEQTFRKFQKEINEIRAWSVNLATVNTAIDTLFYIDDIPVQFAFLDRLEQHVNESGPIFLHKEAIYAWDAEDMKFWQSLDESEAEVVAELIAILCAQGRIELRCPACEGETA